MVIVSKEIPLDSVEKTDFIDVTKQVKDIVNIAGLNAGLVNIFTKHTTTAIRINEDEKGLMADSKKWLECQAPGLKCYEHDNMEKRPDVPIYEPANAHSHLKSLFMGASETIPIVDSTLALGTWQRIFFVDLDGPRKRMMNITIIGE